MMVGNWHWKKAKALLISPVSSAEAAAPLKCIQLDIPIIVTAQASRQKNESDAFIISHQTPVDRRIRARAQDNPIAGKMATSKEWDLNEIMCVYFHNFFSRYGRKH